MGNAAGGKQAVDAAEWDRAAGEAEDDCLGTQDSAQGRQAHQGAEMD